MTSPRRLLSDKPDPRITLHQHDWNWGPVASFNHAFAGGPEPFLALLEDDNWWEPDFLFTAHAALTAQPAANVVWANMRLWQEEAGGSWRDTGRTIWQVSPAAPPQLFFWPQILQLANALHSNGAMLCRARISAAAVVPTGTPFAIIEPVRERLLPGGWLLLPRPLAHFALTRHTARSADRGLWAHASCWSAPVSSRRYPWTKPRWPRFGRISDPPVPPSTSLLFHLALSGVQRGKLLRAARAGDWIRFIAGVVRHPLALVRALRFRRDHPVLWPRLQAAARERTAEARARVGSSAVPPGLMTKSLP